MKRRGIFLLSLDAGDASPSQGNFLMEGVKEGRARLNGIVNFYIGDYFANF